MNRTLNISLLLLILFALSCASTKSSKAQFIGIDEKLISRDYQGALNQIKKAKDKFYKEKEKALYYVDAGMLHHYNGDFELSNKLLSKAETAFNELYTKSLGRGAASMLLNDNVLEYSGEDYEDVYLNVFKALIRANVPLANNETYLTPKNSASSFSNLLWYLPLLVNLLLSQISSR